MAVIHTPGRFAGRASRPGEDARSVVERVDDLRSQIADLMDSEDKRQMGARLRQERVHSPYKQREAARRANVELRTWQAWEGGRGINPQNARIAAKALSVPPERILEGPAVSEVDQQQEQLDRIQELLEANHEMLKRVVAFVVATELAAAAADTAAVAAAAQGGARPASAQGRTAKGRRRRAS